MTNKERVDLAIATEEAFDDLFDAEKSIKIALGCTVLSEMHIDTQALETALKLTTDAMHRVIDFTNFLRND